MDMITLAMAKAYADEQRKAYIKTTEEVVLSETTVEFGGDSIGQYAPETPLDIAEGDRLTIVWDGVQYNCTVFYDEQHGMMWFGNTKLMFGEDTGEPFMYIQISNSNGSHLEFTALDAGTHTFSIVKHAETIYPKYLPAPVVDFDELGLTTPVLELVNAGGGGEGLENIANEPILKAFPSSGDYIAKLTISGMGVMYVNPVYTLFDEEGFVLAHFDSYLEQNSQLIKFYVRVLRPGQYHRDFVAVVVGFYA